MRDNLNATGAATVTTQGDMLYATAANALARLAKGTANQLLKMNAGATAPEWAAGDHTLLTNVGTNTHAQVDTHLAASAAVHGLPASVNVLGNRDAAGEFVQRGSSSQTAAPSASLVARLSYPNITFAVAFSAAPILISSGRGDPAQDIAVGAGCANVSATTITTPIVLFTAGSNIGTYLYYFVALGT